MREREARGGGVRMGEGRDWGARARGPERARMGRAGSGWVMSRDQNPRHAQPQIGIQSRNEIRDETRQNTRLNTTSDQRNMIQHDATLMST
jgi:hypothetical protein